MQDVRVRIAIIVVTLLALLGGGAGLMAARRPAPPPILISQPGSASATPVTAAPASPAGSPVSTPQPASAPVPETKYYVHVAGAVKNPSLYLLSPGSRVMQAIRAAGGPTSKADLDAVNLAEKIHDGEKIYIPNKAAVTQAVMIAPPGNALGHESSGSDTPAAVAEAPSSPAVAAKPTKVLKSAKGGGTGKAAKLSSPSQGQVDINTATADQLQRLPGIGPAMAARVLAYRQQAGGFQKVEELQEISGIGPKKYAKIAPLVKLN